MGISSEFQRWGTWRVRVRYIQVFRLPWIPRSRKWLWWHLRPQPNERVHWRTHSPCRHQVLCHHLFHYPITSHYPTTILFTLPLQRCLYIAISWFGKIHGPLYYNPMIPLIILSIIATILASLYIYPLTNLFIIPTCSVPRISHWVVSLSVPW